MTVRTLQIDPVTNGLTKVNGQLVLLSDGAAIAQAVGSALQLILGEWFLDDPVNPRLGVPYFQKVLVAHPDPTVLVSVFRTAILGVLGVTEVVSLQLLYDRAARRLSVAWAAITDAGRLSGTEALAVAGGGP